MLAEPNDWRWKNTVVAKPKQLLLIFMWFIECYAILDHFFY